ncbi:MAG TPA: hypothetical protein VFT55_16810 [Planctomycetota bacterium]|nr:hypothetical protein [Planctomycetota bacterium]
MKPAHSLIPLAFVLAAPAFAAQPAAASDPRIAVVLQPATVEFHIMQEQPSFLAVVLVSLSPDLRHFLTGLPPMLDQALVIDWGFAADGVFSTRFRDTTFPAGIRIYAQGVTISDAGILSSNVGEFVLDGTGNG